MKNSSTILIEVLLKTIDKMGIKGTIQVLEVSNNYSDENKKLIDLTNTPDELKSKIITMYQKQETPSGRGLLNYFMKNDLNIYNLF